MIFINYFVYLLPGILGFLVFYLLVCISSSKENIKKWNIVSIAAASIILTVYYLPKYDILSCYTLPYMQVETESELRELKPEHTKAILEVINRHTFTRSAVRTVENQNLSGNRWVILSTHEYDEASKRYAIIHLYVFAEPVENNVLQINEQMYNVKDKPGLSRDIYKVLGESGILD